jgi:hypothetical protein
MFFYRLSTYWWPIAPASLPRLGIEPLQGVDEVVLVLRLQVGAVAAVECSAALGLSSFLLLLWLGELELLWSQLVLDF